MKFEISPDQQRKINEWLKAEIYPPIIARQRERTPDPHPMKAAMWEMGYPYEGASGGGLTYEFTPTGLGVVVVARYGEHKLDVSDYDLW